MYPSLVPTIIHFSFIYVLQRDTEIVLPMLCIFHTLMLLKNHHRCLAGNLLQLISYRGGSRLIRIEVTWFLRNMPLSDLIIEFVLETFISSREMKLFCTFLYWNQSVANWMQLQFCNSSYSYYILITIYRLTCRVRYGCRLDIWRDIDLSTLLIETNLVVKKNNFCSSVWIRYWCILFFRSGVLFWIQLLVSFLHPLATGNQRSLAYKGTKVL